MALNTLEQEGDKGSITDRAIRAGLDPNTTYLPELERFEHVTEMLERAKAAGMELGPDEIPMIREVQYAETENHRTRLAAELGLEPKTATWDEIEKLIN